MAIASNVALPSQPANGRVRYFPLGGDGFTAPTSAYSVRINLASDASGGNNTLRIKPDPQFVAVCAFLNTGVVAGSAAIDCEFVIRHDQVEEISVIKELPLVGIVSFTNSGLWTPPLYLLNATDRDATLPPFIRSTIPNVDGETHTLQTIVFNFNKRVRETTPLNQIVASLPRSSTFI